MTGTVCAQAITFLLIPFIARIYTPDNFGIMTLFSTIVNLLIAVSCGCYEQAIVLPQDDNKGWDVLALSLFFCSFTSFVFFLIILFFYHDVSRIIFKVDSLIWLWFLPLVIWFGGIRMALTYWNTRRKKFKALSASKMIESIGNSGIKLASGLAVGNKLGGLIGGIIGRSLFPSLFLGIIFYLRDFKSFARMPKKNKLVKVLKKYRNFLFFSTWTAITVNISRSLPVFFLAFLFDNRIVGAFGLADNTLRVPIGIIGNSVRQVFLQWAADTISKKKRLSVGLLKATSGLFILGVLPFGILFYFGEEIFVLVFGNNWSEAGKFAEVLSPWLMTLCINPPATVVYTVLQKQGLYLVYFIVTALGRGLVFIIGMFLNLDVLRLLILLSGISTFFILVEIGYAFKLAARSDSKLNLG